MLTLHDTCGGIVESTEAIINVDDLGFELLGVDAPTRALQPGMISVLELHTNATSLDVSVDFSALDSSYTAGSETVVNLGNGSYRVSYSPSVFGGPAIGTYSLPIVLTDPTGVEPVVGMEETGSPTTSTGGAQRQAGLA